MKRVGIQLMALAFLAMYSLPVLAGEGHGGEKATLPQLNVALYPGLLFWLVICFFTFFVIVSRLAIPTIRKTQGHRKAIITADLNAAKEASDASAQVMEAYESALADARGQAQKTVANIIQAAEAEATEAREKQAQDLSHRTIVAEENIAAARDAALKEAPRLVPVLVQDILGKLIPAQGR